MALAEAHSPITSHVAPDAAVVRAFLEAMIAKRAFDELIASTVALVEKMRDLNTDLTRQLAAARGAHPPSETTFRLKRESAANDGGTSKREKQKRPPKVSPHGRSNLPEHLARVPEVCSVPPELAVSPRLRRLRDAAQPQAPRAPRRRARALLRAAHSARDRRLPKVPRGEDEPVVGQERYESADDLARFAVEQHEIEPADRRDQHEVVRSRALEPRASSVGAELASPSDGPVAERPRLARRGNPRFDLL